MYLPQVWWRPWKNMTPRRVLSSPPMLRGGWKWPARAALRRSRVWYVCPFTYTICYWRWNASMKNWRISTAAIPPVSITRTCPLIYLHFTLFAKDIFDLRVSLFLMYKYTVLFLSCASFNISLFLQMKKSQKGWPCRSKKWTFWWPSASRLLILRAMCIRKGWTTHQGKKSGWVLFTSLLAE